MDILVTGCAGFIGYHLSQALLTRGEHVIGIDNLNPYYDVTLKQARLTQLQAHPNFQFQKIDLADQAAMTQLFVTHKFDCVVNLAAQAGVRYSLEAPNTYIQSNLVGFGNLLECCRQHAIKHLVFASSSSVYGANTATPFSEHHHTDHPVSLYAATKKANEVMAHSYAHLYQLPCTGIRFFTVYGPWGRPDMALFKFTEAMLNNQAIDVYNHGEMARDFTYIDDIIGGVMRIIDQPAKPNTDWSAEHPDPASSLAPYRLYNIGNHNPVKLTDFIVALEKALGIQAQQNRLPMQAGDVPVTYADSSLLAADLDYQPNTPLDQGIAAFVAWYREWRHFSKT